MVNIPGIIPLLRNNLNDGGGALLLAVVGEEPDPGSLKG